MKRTAFTIAFLAMTTVAANAQEGVTTPIAEIGTSFSSTTINPSGGAPSFTSPGASISFGYNFNKAFSAIADLGYYHNGDSVNLSPKTASYMFGPRVNWRKERVTPYVQALFGGVHVHSDFLDPNTGNSAPQNAFASAFGGGMDIKVSEHLSFKPFQLEYMVTRVPNIWGVDSVAGHMQNDLRYSAGIVFRMGSK